MSSWGASQPCNDRAFEESVQSEDYIEIALAQGFYGIQDFYKRLYSPVFTPNFSTKGKDLIDIGVVL